ncbi:protein of unknown function (plasmid) [Streptantibioticus cattleyicolor NRRL 8057 = DSM 46488]|nr:protein of unknown function [Streptantibioticus cattleyicolor NRRL 8057 = DSM 46488]
MALFPALHTTSTTPREHRSLRALLSGAIRRIADSPLDSPVLAALPAHQTVDRSERARRRPHAQWQRVTDREGKPRLIATWHAGG